MPGRTRLSIAVVIGIALIGYLLIAASYPLVDPDEGRNAEVAREMAAGGDLVVPHLAGMPYLDKPPGLFWAVALSVRLLGNHPFAARLPSVVAAVLLLLLIARLAIREVDPDFARRAVALTAAAPMFAVLAAYVIFDMALALCVTLIWTALARELIHGRDHRRRAAMFVALAAGLLIKGPVMLAWAIGGSLAAALLLRSLTPMRWLGWWPGWLIVLTFAGGWFALATARFPEYPRYAFLEESLERLTSGSFRREQPWWFVPVVLAGGTLPWSLATPWRLRGRSWSGESPLGAAMDVAAHQRVIVRVALGFVLFAAVFFTLSRSKLVTYLLPALPPLAWIAATAWSDARKRRATAWILVAFYGLLAAGFEARCFISLPGLAAPTPEMLGGWHVTAIAFACAAALALLGGLARRPELPFVAALLFTPIVLVANARELVAVAASQSGAPLARVIVGTGGGPVRYDACYSPGTDFLLGGISTVVSELGAETTSNYQLRYRPSLQARGLWTPLPESPREDAAQVVVRPVGQATLPEAGWRPLFRDPRFVAYRREP